MSQGRIIAYLGGTRSGKSRLAEARASQLCAEQRCKPAYLATAREESLATDPSLAERVDRHRQRRGPDWKTQVLALPLGPQLQGMFLDGHKVVLLDGVGLLLSGWLCDSQGRMDQPAAWAELLQALQEFRQQGGMAVLVMDELGQGGMSFQPVSDAFRDANGLANQDLASLADELWVAHAGQPLRVK